MLVQVTPWSVSPTHWVTRIEPVVNTGVAAPPPSPPGNPALWVRADLQALGPVNPWLDQSGHGNDLPLASGATAPTNTAAVGPNPTLPAVVYNPASWMAVTLANKLIGATNFTIAVIAKTNAPNTQQVIAALGGGGAVDGVAVGYIPFVPNDRVFRFGGVSNNDFGAGSNDWEAWVLTSDAAGNLTALVNGVNVPVVPNNATAIFGPNSIFVGADGGTGQRWDGEIFEVIVWTTAQNPAQVYAYQHEVTGL